MGKNNSFQGGYGADFNEIYKGLNSIFVTITLSNDSYYECQFKIIITGTKCT